MRGTPLPAWSFIAGRVAQGMFVGFLLVAVCVLFGVLVFDVSITVGKLPAFILTLLIGAATFSALGLAVTGLVPNAEAAPAIVNASILPLEFISGIFIPLNQAPDWLATVADLFPVKHFADTDRAKRSCLLRVRAFCGTDWRSSLSGGWPV